MGGGSPSIPTPVQSVGIDGMNPERTCEGSGIPDWKTTTAIATTMNQTITVRITS